MAIHVVVCGGVCGGIWLVVVVVVVLWWCMVLTLIIGGGGFFFFFFFFFWKWPFLLACSWLQTYCSKADTPANLAEYPDFVTQFLEYLQRGVERIPVPADPPCGSTGRVCS